MNFLPEGKLINTRENISALSSVDSLYHAMEDRKILESRAVLCDSEHNLHVNLGTIKGIIPRENGALGLDDGSTRDIAVISKVNKPVCFYIDEIREDESKKPYAILNRRAVQYDCLESYVSRLVNGDIIDAVICHMESFGAFVDIGCGINSLLPIDSISVSRIPDPDARFFNGQTIKVIVKERDSLNRIVLSHKELLGTWEENAEKFSVGETVPGIIRSIERYGIFVELTPNLAGLAEYTDGVYAGQKASVYIKSIIPERMKIKLIIVDSFDSKDTVEKPEYFITCKHIRQWRYSPDECERRIETFF